MEIVTIGAKSGMTDIVTEEGSIAGVVSKVNSYMTCIGKCKFHIVMWSQEEHHLDDPWFVDDAQSDMKGIVDLPVRLVGDEKRKADAFGAHCSIEEFITDACMKRQFFTAQRSWFCINADGNCWNEFGESRNGGTWDRAWWPWSIVESRRMGGRSWCWGVKSEEGGICGRRMRELMWRRKRGCARRGLLKGRGYRHTWRWQRNWFSGHERWRRSEGECLVCV